MWRRLRLALVGLAVLYVVALAGLFALMLQPPPRFAAAMARVPGPVFGLVPFRVLWNVARAGDLQIGDPAPDFLLNTYDRTAQVRLSAFKGQSPVVLVFGSYT